MFPLSPLSRGHGKWVQNKQKVEVYFEPEVSFTAESGHIGSGGGGQCGRNGLFFHLELSHACLGLFDW